MESTVTQLRRPIDEPGDFLDWMIERGSTLRGAALALADADSAETQQMWRTYCTELEPAS